MVAVYIADTQLITAAGPNSYANYCAHRAGINTYQFANYHTQDHCQVVLSLVPEAVFPPLAEALEEGPLSGRDERLIQLAAVSAQLLFDSFKGEPVPLIMAGPQNYPGFTNQLPSQFFKCLAMQASLPIEYPTSRVVCTGRTGMLEAIRLARHYLANAPYTYVAVGGVDSPRHTDWLHFLDRDDRLKSERGTRTGDSFVPGEAASYLLLTTNPELAMDYNGYRIRLTEPGFADEPGHLYSSQPYLGQGLDSAVKQALAALPEAYSIDAVYSSMNGENFWAKEFGVAMTRSAHRLKEHKHEHPADCYGDLGAAAGGALIALAAHYATVQQPKNCLVTTSADTEHRAAICVIPERISA